MRERARSHAQEREGGRERERESGRERQWEGERWGSTGRTDTIVRRIETGEALDNQLFIISYHITSHHQSCLHHITSSIKSTSHHIIQIIKSISLYVTYRCPQGAKTQLSEELRQIKHSTTKSLSSPTYDTCPSVGRSTLPPA